MSKLSPIVAAALRQALEKKSPPSPAADSASQPDLADAPPAEVPVDEIPPAEVPIDEVPVDDVPIDDAPVHPPADEADHNIEPHPYWIPPGADLDGWPPELRNEALSVINQDYRELVLLAKPGLQRSAGITTVYLLWLEIVSQIELAHAKPAAGPGADPLQLAGLMPEGETRAQMIQRYLRLVQAKLNASGFLLRLQKFQAESQSNKHRPVHIEAPSLSTLPRRLPNSGKNESC